MAVQPKNEDRNWFLSTPTFNEFADAFNWVNRNFQLTNNTNTKPEFYNRDWIKFRNMTGANVVEGQVIGLDAALITPSPKQRGFLNSVSHAGVIPQYVTHRNRIGIVTQACPNEKIGQCCVSGLASTAVNILPDHIANWRPFADVVDGNTNQLQSDPDGQVQIIWTETGGTGTPTAGIQKARVKVGSHASRLFQATVTGAEIASGAAGTVQLLGSTQNLIATWTNAPANATLPVGDEVWVQRRDDGDWDIVFTKRGTGTATPDPDPDPDPTPDPQQNNVTEASIVCSESLVSKLLELDIIDQQESLDIQRDCQIVPVTEPEPKGVCPRCAAGMIPAKVPVTITGAAVWDTFLRGGEFGSAIPRLPWSSGSEQVRNDIINWMNSTHSIPIGPTADGTFFDRCGGFITQRFQVVEAGGFPDFGWPHPRVGLTIMSYRKVTYEVAIEIYRLSNNDGWELQISLLEFWWSPDGNDNNTVWGPPPPRLYRNRPDTFGSTVFWRPDPRDEIWTARFDDGDCSSAASFGPDTAEPRYRTAGELVEAFPPDGQITGGKIRYDGISGTIG